MLGSAVSSLSPFGNDRRLILRFDDHVFDAADAFDGLNLTVGNVGGNHVCGQGQVPRNVQLAVGGLLDGGDHSRLLSLQSLCGSAWQKAFCAMPMVEKPASKVEAFSRTMDTRTMSVSEYWGVSSVS